MYALNRYLSLVVTLSTLSGEDDGGGVTDVVTGGRGGAGHTFHSHGKQRSFTHCHLKIRDRGTCDKSLLWCVYGKFLLRDIQHNLI